VAAEIAALGHPLDLILCERPASDRTRASTRLSSRAAGTAGCTPPQPNPSKSQHFKCSLVAHRFYHFATASDVRLSKLAANSFAFQA